jgi:pyridoxine 4-dehydrogenase
MLSDIVLLANRPVRRMGFGAMQLPGPGVFGPPKDRAQAVAILRRAIDAGVNHLDTAQFYGPDVANGLIHDALHPYPADLVLVSKSVQSATVRVIGWTHSAQTTFAPASSPTSPPWSWTRFRWST